jgi:hypothetical protein
VPLFTCPLCKEPKSQFTDHCLRASEEREDAFGLVESFVKMHERSNCLAPGPRTGVWQVLLLFEGFKLHQAKLEGMSMEE